MCALAWVDVGGDGNRRVEVSGEAEGSGGQGGMVCDERRRRREEGVRTTSGYGSMKRWKDGRKIRKKGIKEGKEDV
jgi:hypothetical protein